MGLPVEINPLFVSSTGGYQVGRSLRFRSSASAYLNRTFGTPTSSTIYTWSGWVKRGALGATNYLFGASTTTNFGFNSSNNIVLTLAGTTAVTTTAVYRDPSAWYHVVYQQNGAAQTISINGVSAGTGTTANTVFNTAIAHQLSAANTTSYFDGYLAEVNFIDGQALTPSSFGSYDTNGVWQPKKYTSTYGTNGFYLPFSNTTSTTTLVADSSGNSNNWTPNNISLTAGTTYDSMIDSPMVSASASNYAVLNPLRTASSSTVSNGNLTFTDTTNNHNYLSTIGMPSGKWYFEFVAGATSFSAAHAGIALSTVSPDTYIGSDTNGYAYQATTGQVLYNNSALGTYSTWTGGDVIGVAFDATSGKLYVAKNNTWQNSGNPAAGTGAVATGIASNTWFFGIGGNPSSTLNANFGQQPFTYTPPTGYNALNTYNLPAATINNGALYMAATTYTGTGASNTISNANNNTIGTTFQPDLVWVKSRSAATDHKLTDSVRGVTKALISDTTGAETTDANGLTAFGSTGFTLGTDTTYNNNTATYIGWQWKASGSTVSNTSGSITSTVSANPTAGFSIVRYTGNGTAGATVGHGLGVAPSMFIIKETTQATGGWSVYHTSIGATAAVQLNTTGASITSANWWNNTSPTSSVFSLGSSGELNDSGQTNIAYCFAAISGYSAFGSYTGNGSTDGPFAYTGFRPRFVMIKGVNRATLWEMYDTSRNTYNLSNALLDASASSAESTSVGVSIDILSNGFKIRNPGAAPDNNASGETYIYMAFAENPFTISRAR